MTRKGKQPGGHNPLTYHERAKLTAYGTTTVHLDTASQRPFGHCCLGLEPAQDPVATPSGHIYSREAIVSYLLTKTQEGKQARVAYQAALQQSKRSKQEAAQAQEAALLGTFQQGERAAALEKVQAHAHAREVQVSKHLSTETKTEGQATLQRTSYWLADFQPQHEGSVTESDSTPPPPPERPPSPMSGRPGLRLKDLTPLVLNREGTRAVKGSGGKRQPGAKDHENDDENDDEKKKKKEKKEEDESSVRKRKPGEELQTGRCLCAVSHKAITTQKVVAIRKTGQVMLWDMFQSLARPSMTCPVTGRTFQEKDILILQQAASGFAASGKVESKRYRPTLT